MTQPPSSSSRAVIDSLAERYQLPARAAVSLTVLADMIGRDPRAPTALRDELRIVDDHIGDSLVALELEELRAASSLADMGSGAGLPGLVLAIAMPHARVALIEASARKAQFIAGAVAACGAANVEIVHARVEAWTAGSGRFDVVTARAVAALDVVAEYAAPLLRIGGVLVAWRGRRDARAEAQLVSAASLLSMEVLAPQPVFPYPGAEHRHLHRIIKTDTTPARFPRRPGAARKRPLGGGVRSQSSPSDV